MDSTLKRLDSLRSQAARALRAGELDLCEQRCRDLLAERGEDPDALQLLALVAARRGDLGRAERLLRQALSRRPSDARLANTLGVVLFEQGRTAEAVGCYQGALALDPAYAKCHSNLGNALVDLGKPEEAGAAHDRAIELDPGSIEFHFNRANALRARGESEKAIEGYARCIALDDRFVPAHTNLAAALVEQGRLAEAERANERALAINPRSFEARNNQAGLLMLRGRLDEAEPAYRAALDLNPDNTETHYNLAVLHRTKGNLEQSARAVDRALALAPDHVGALALRADDVNSRGEWTQAIALLERAHRADPRDLAALSALMRLYQHTCHWEAFERAAARIEELGDGAGSLRFPAEPPMLNVSRVDDPARNLQVARAWSEAIERRMAAERDALAFRHVPGPRARLTVGYLSRNYRNHPSAHLIRGLFAAHDRERVRVHAYSYGPDDGSHWRRSITGDCDSFVDVRDTSDSAAARRIYDDGVDVLVHLAGHTKDNRLEICALRPAPVQVSYLGFPGSTGAGFIDYLLSDRIVTPPEHAHHYSEALVVLPHCYQINDRQQEIDDRPVTRAEHGLREDAFVFVCFNQTYKIEPVMFETWMRILGAVPHSQLWLFDRAGGVAARHLKNAAAEWGIEPERLVFAHRVPKAAHLARLQLANLGLDTRIYTGHTTTSDALWAGVPAVALCGRHFASRVSASILCAIGLPELIADDLDAYETLAVALARTPERLADLRERLWRHRLSAPLFDTERFAGYLEHAYRAMWDTYCAGRAPSRIEVPADG